MRAAILATLVVLSLILLGVAVVYGAEHYPRTTIISFIGLMWISLYYRAKNDGI